MKKRVLFISIGLILMACGANNEEKIIGIWKEMGTGSTIEEFKSDGTFTYTFDDGKTVSGKYKIEGNKLYTNEEGIEEIPSEIIELDDDNLVLGFTGMGMTFETKYKRVN